MVVNVVNGLLVMATFASWCAFDALNFNHTFTFIHITYNLYNHDTNKIQQLTYTVKVKMCFQEFIQKAGDN